MNELQMMFIERTDDELADSMMVGTISAAMEQRLTEKRDKGRGGWFGPECSNEKLKLMLERNINEGDMVDALNLAAMIYMREQLYGDRA